MNFESSPAEKLDFLTKLAGNVIIEKSKILLPPWFLFE